MSRHIRFIAIFCVGILVLACTPTPYMYDDVKYRSSLEALKAVRDDLAINLSYIQPAKSPVGGRALIIVPDRRTLREKGVVTAGDRHSVASNYIVDTLDETWVAQVEAFRKWGMFDSLMVRREDPDGDPDLQNYDYVIWYKLRSGGVGQWYLKSTTKPQRQPVLYEKPANRRRELVRQLAAIGQMAKNKNEKGNLTKVSEGRGEPEAQAQNSSIYRILERRVFDNGIKTSLSLRLVVGHSMDGIKLRRVLNAEFGKARAMQGFKYRDRLNQIFVYLYESEAARRSSGANWLAMLYWDSYDGRVKQPRVSINNAKVDGLRSAPPNLSQDSNNKNARNSLNNMKLEYKLATVDAGYRVQPDDISIARFGSLLDQLANKYVEDRIKIADVTVAAMNILREKGLREKLLNIMEGLNSIFYEPLQNQKYAQHVAIYVTLRNKGESHFGAVSGLRASFRVLRVN